MQNYALCIKKTTNEPNSDLELCSANGNRSMTEQTSDRPLRLRRTHLLHSGIQKYQYTHTHRHCHSHCVGIHVKRSRNRSRSRTVVNNRAETRFELNWNWRMVAHERWASKATVKTRFRHMQDSLKDTKRARAGEVAEARERSVSGRVKKLKLSSQRVAAFSTHIRPRHGLLFSVLFRVVKCSTDC